MLALITALETSTATAARGQARDTLMYAVAIVAVRPHLSVEARLSNGDSGSIALAAPPSARPAGTTVDGLAATDDRGAPLVVRRERGGFVIERAHPGPIRFRYRLSFRDAVAGGSTGAGMDSLRLYAVTRSLFVAPDPMAYAKTSRPYPLLRVSFVTPPGWHAVTGWASDGDEFRPADGNDLLGATVAAAADFRIYRDSAAGLPYQLAIRGRRYFTDSTLKAVITASLSKAAEVFGPVPGLARVTYTSDLGRKGRVSGSLQGQASIGLIWEPSEILERARSHDTFHETLHLWFGGALETERWWTEGVTDYFAARLYAEWRGRPEDLAALCYESYRNYLRIEHNTRMTMAEENRRSVSGDNTELLTYRKGMLAGLILDAAIRQATGGRQSLDEVARRLLAMAATRRSHRLRETEIRDVVVDLGGAGATLAWRRVVEGSGLLTETEVAGALQEVAGLPLEPPPVQLKRRKALQATPPRQVDRP